MTKKKQFLAKNQINFYIVIKGVKIDFNWALELRLISLSQTDIFENMREKLLIKSNF